MTPGIAKPSLDKECDVDLMRILSESKEGSTAEAALEVLYNRHAGFLTATALGSRLEAQGVDPSLVVARTFQKVWARANTFDPARQYPKSDPNRAVRLWMLVMLKNELRDHRRKALRRIDHDDYDDDREIKEAKKESVSAESQTAEKVSERRAIFDEWFTTLDEDDQKILLASAPYIEPHPPFKCYIPAEDLERLADELGVLPETVKVKRQRLFKRCREFFRQKSKQ